jgi:hypothetical protein
MRVNLTIVLAAEPTNTQRHGTRSRRAEPNLNLWRWTAVFAAAIRQALCPLPGLMTLLEGIVCGTLNVADERRRGEPQLAALASLLARWVFG